MALENSLSKNYNILKHSVKNTFYQNAVSKILYFKIQNKKIACFKIVKNYTRV